MPANCEPWPGKRNAVFGVKPDYNRLKRRRCMVRVARSLQGLRQITPCSRRTASTCGFPVGKSWAGICAPAAMRRRATLGSRRPPSPQLRMPWPNHPGGVPWKVVVLDGERRAMGQQELDEIGIALPASPVERGRAFFSARVDRNAGREQRSNGRRAMVAGEIGKKVFIARVDGGFRRDGGLTGEVAIQRRQIGVGAASCKQGGDVALPALRCQCVCGTAILPLGVDVRAVVEQLRDDCGTSSSPDGPMQRLFRHGDWLRGGRRRRRAGGASPRGPRDRAYAGECSCRPRTRRGPVEASRRRDRRCSVEW